MQEREALPVPGLAHMAGEVRMVLRGASHTHRFLRARLAFLLLTTIIVDLVATVAMFALEGDAPGSDFDDLGGALFWVSTQLTTVSSQMRNPVTTVGRILDVLLQVWAISVVAMLAASLAAFLRARHVELLVHTAPPQPPGPPQL